MHPYDDLCAVWNQCCVATPWLALPGKSTTATGINGANSLVALGVARIRKLSCPGSCGNNRYVLLNCLSSWAQELQMGREADNQVVWKSIDDDLHSEDELKEENE